MTELAMDVAKNQGTWLGRNHFLMRRLHSLTGIVPVGVFVCFHLFTNMQMALGTFQHEVEWIHSLPALLFMEVFGLWLPIGFHAALGLVYTFGGRPNNVSYPHGDNWRYTMQRVTGVIALAFIFVHVATLRWGWTFGVLDTTFYLHGPEPERLPLAQASTAMALQHSWMVAAFYVVGVFSVVYHFANGLWSAAITWGLTISVQAQRRWGGVCAVVGLVLAVFSAAAIWSALVYEPTAGELAAIQTLKTMAAQGAEQLH